MSSATVSGIRRSPGQSATLSDPLTAFLAFPQVAAVVGGGESVGQDARGLFGFHGARLRRAFTAALLLGLVSTAQAGTIKKLPPEGLVGDSLRVLSAPVVVGSQFPPLKIGPFVAAYDRQAEIVRGWGGNEKPTFVLAPGLDLAGRFEDSLWLQAVALGFRAVFVEREGTRVVGQRAEGRVSVSVVAADGSPKLQLSDKDTSYRLRQTDDAVDLRAARERVTSDLTGGLALRPATAVEVAPRGDKEALAEILRHAGVTVWADSDRNVTRVSVYRLDGTIDTIWLLGGVQGGIRLAKANEPVWEVSGRLKEVSIEGKFLLLGNFIGYGFVEVELDVRSPAGDHWREGLRAASFPWPGPPFGQGPEPTLAKVIAEAAIDTIARLNRQCFKAPLGPEIENGPPYSSKATGTVIPVDLWCAPALPALLSRLETESDYRQRAGIINALARIGSDEAVETLARRYDREVDLCRWYTLKALAYIGGEKAAMVINDKGTREKDKTIQQLVKRLGLK